MMTFKGADAVSSKTISSLKDYTVKVVRVHFKIVLNVASEVFIQKLS